MRRKISIAATAAGVTSGASAAGVYAMTWLVARDDAGYGWFYLLVVAFILTILALILCAIGVTYYDAPIRMRSVPRGIAVGRSGAPEITDPMPTPARVRKPASDALSPDKNSF